jgi:two-component system, OmpR family, response regulator
MLEMDSTRHSCQVAGQEVDLTATEFALLSTLLAHPEKVYDRNALIDRIYGPNNALSGRTVDSHIRNIRAKLAALGCTDAIVTVHGVGVRLGSCAR